MNKSALAAPLSFALLISVSLLLLHMMFRIEAVGFVPERVAAPKVEKLAPVEKIEVIDGYYECLGPKDDKGEPAYAGIVTIVKKTKDAYFVNWAVNGASFVGIGTLHGRTFTVAWKSTEQQRVIGLTIYKLSEDNKCLAGVQLVIPGEGLEEEETLILLKASSRTK